MAVQEQDPFTTLGLDDDATEEQIRQRYLQLVREFPPEREPDKFAAVRAAYEQLKDPVVALKSRLFLERAGATLDSITRELDEQARSQRIPTALLLSLAD